MMEWKDALKNNKRWKEGKEVEKKRRNWGKNHGNAQNNRKMGMKINYKL